MTHIDHHIATQPRAQIGTNSRFQAVCSLLWRLLLAIFGSYACTLALLSLVARLLALLPGWTLAGTVLGGMLLSFLLYAALVMTVIASTRLYRTSLWLLGITLAAGLLCQLPALSSGGML